MSSGTGWGQARGWMVGSVFGCIVSRVAVALATFNSTAVDGRNAWTATLAAGIDVRS